MTALQKIQKRDLSFAYQIGVAQHSVLSAMWVGQSADDIANGFHGRSLAGVTYSLEEAIDEIALKLDRLTQ